jgi:peptidoglycan/xylan/chitin deacetylase (PgdA/CDA1 family)
LDLLDQLQLKATFFVVGARADAHPDLILEIRRRGHAVASHGYHHEHHLLRTPGWIALDTARSVQAVANSGPAPRWYRPPYGQLTARTILEARRHGMEVVLWSQWGREWAEQSHQPVLERLCIGMRPGAIFLLHDGDSTSRPGTTSIVHDTLEPFAHALRQCGLQAVTLDTLLS